MGTFYPGATGAQLLDIPIGQVTVDVLENIGSIYPLDNSLTLLGFKLNTDKSISGWQRNTVLLASASSVVTVPYDYSTVSFNNSGTMALTDNPSTGMPGYDATLFCATDDANKNIGLYAVIKLYKSSSTYRHTNEWLHGSSGKKGKTTITASGYMNPSSNPWLSAALDNTSILNLSEYQFSDDVAGSKYATPGWTLYKTLGNSAYTYKIYKIGQWERGAVPPKYKFAIRTGVDFWTGDPTSYDSSVNSWINYYPPIGPGSFGGTGKVAWTVDKYITKVSDSTVKAYLNNNTGGYAYQYGAHLQNLPSDVYAITDPQWIKPSNSEILLTKSQFDYVTVNFQYTSSVTTAATFTLYLCDPSGNVLETLATESINQGTNTIPVQFNSTYEKYIPAKKMQEAYYFKWEFNANGTVYRCNGVNQEVTSGLTSMTFVANPQNVPLWIDSSNVYNRAILNRKHSDKYALLVNNEDTVTMRWRGASYAVVDTTLTMTLRFGDSVIGSYKSTGAYPYEHFTVGPWLSPPVQQGQLFKINGYLEDCRGRRSVEKNFDMLGANDEVLEYIRCYLYSVPRVTISGYRCTSDGTPDEKDGTYIKFTYSWSISALDYGLSSYSEGLNPGKVSVHIIPTHGTTGESTNDFTITSATGTGSKIVSVGTAEVSFDLVGTITDFLGKSNTAAKVFVPSSRVYMDFRYGGDGLGLGKVCEDENKLEIGWDTTIFGNLNVQGNINLTGSAQAATTADAVIYRDTKNIGASTVQSAIDIIAGKAGLTSTQVQKMIDTSINNIKGTIPTDAHIEQMIIEKIDGIVFPPSVTTEQCQKLINEAIADLVIPSDEHINSLIDSKVQGLAPPDLSGYATKTEIANSYYNKSQIDTQMAGVDTKITQSIAGKADKSELTDYYTKKEVDDKIAAAQPTLAAEDIAYGTSNVKEALDSMGTVVDTLPTAIDEVDTKVEGNSDKMDAILAALQNINQTEWQDGNLMYF